MDSDCETGYVCEVFEGNRQCMEPRPGVAKFGENLINLRQELLQYFVADLAQSLSLVIISSSLLSGSIFPHLCSGLSVPGHLCVWLL